MPKRAIFDEQLKSMGGVFISYRQKSASEKRTVKAFAEQLRNRGIAVILDQLFLDEHPGGPAEGWDKWSSDNALCAGKVLIVGTPAWFECFNHKQPPGTGLGAACEADDLRDRIYQSGGVVEDIRVVTINDTHARVIPAKLRRYHHFHYERDFENILKWLSGANGVPPRPPSEDISVDSRIVLSADAVGVAVDTPTLDAELTITGDLNSLSEERKRAVLEAVEKLLGIDGNLTIKKIRRGSIKLTIELSADLAAKLKRAIRSGALAELGVTKIDLYESMAAGIAARVLDVRNEVIRESLSDFQNIEHRLERVAIVNGIEFINDSKATNVNSTWYALESMEKPIIWIVGGTGKGNDYSELHELVKQKVMAIVCLGKDNSKIHLAFSDLVPTIIDTDSANDAVQRAYDLSEPGDVVLLSPACPSFDLFENYEDRGRQFKKAVMALKR